ncbi:unnamed protein product [Cuscuta epithymum]|uniref:Diacylglycerol O-acyltransferase n=1 Tax=Cuscuta epithymum TaxID=186058 RepID=A0AAV0GDI4_9ASTE|nr:unnamed protein product [Cuscuta epithymum]CAH9145997.1 unnamed protein product [Cuscuta epithymum]
MESLEIDEPLTPAGRLFLQPEMNQIIHAVAGVKNPFDVDAVKSAFADSLLVKHPRFSSLMVKDSSGRERWRRTQVNIDDHFILLREPLTGDRSVSDEDAVNDYLADLSVSTPLPSDKPLWEFHLLLAHKCAVLRIHHALGDGISIMSLFLSCCRKTNSPIQPPSLGGVKAGRRRRWGLKEVAMVVWYTVVYVLEFVLRSLWLKDKKTALSGGAGVELWPRKLATAKLTINDMKTVKKAVADATINDVLFGVIACGLSRYLAIRSSKELKDGLQITGLAMVNLRPQPGLQDMTKMMSSGKSDTQWGNKFGYMLLPVYYFHKASNNPLDFVKRAKSMIDKKKLSLEALCSYRIGNFVMSFLGVKLASMLNYRILCNTTFAISNVIGPQEEIFIAGNPITYIRTSTSSLPHAITIHMVSYNGKADLQILVAKDIIPDPKILSKCFEDALMEMKKQAGAEQSTSHPCEQITS